MCLNPADKINEIYGKRGFFRYIFNITNYVHMHLMVVVAYLYQLRSLSAHHNCLIFHCTYWHWSLWHFDNFWRKKNNIPTTKSIFTQIKLSAETFNGLKKDNLSVEKRHIYMYKILNIFIMREKKTVGNIETFYIHRYSCQSWFRQYIHH